MPPSVHKCNLSKDICLDYVTQICVMDLFISGQRIKKIIDIHFKILTYVVISGWPQSMKRVSLEIRQYYKFQLKKMICYFSTSRNKMVSFLFCLCIAFLFIKKNTKQPFSIAPLPSLDSKQPSQQMAISFNKLPGNKKTLMASMRCIIGCI